MNSHQGDRNYEQNTDIFKVKSAKSKQMELIASAAERKKKQSGRENYDLHENKFEINNQLDN